MLKGIFFFLISRVSCRPQFCCSTEARKNVSDTRTRGKLSKEREV